MSFAAPLVLLGLLALPLLPSGTRAHARRRARAAAAFAAPHLAASVAPTRPGWRRHAPMLAFALALAALLVAAARPQTTVAVAVEHASIMLVTDVSGSMEAQDVAPSRLVAARRAATSFVDGVPENVNVGVMAFNQRATVLQSPTPDRIAVKTALQRLRSSGGTATGDAVRAALRLLSTAPAQTGGKPPPGAIVLLSDGESTSGRTRRGRRSGRATPPHPDLHRRARHRRGDDHGSAQGRRDRDQARPARPAELRRWPAPRAAAPTPRATPTQLSQVYERLGSQLGRRDEPRQITLAVRRRRAGPAARRRGPLPALVRAPRLDKEHP